MTSRPRFHAPEIRAEGQRLALKGEEFHHLRNVLRLKAGDRVSLFDGRGAGYSATLETVGREEAVIRVEREEHPSSESNLRLHLAVGLAKGEKLDLVIQKVTELGVTAVHPLATRRVDVKLKPGHGESRLQRWRRVALEACKQSGRTRLPEIHPPMDLDEFLALEMPAPRIVLDPGGGSLADILPGEIPRPFTSLTVAVGPEGGWHSVELDKFLHGGYLTCRLGPRVLRAETASILAAGLLQFLAGDLRPGGPPSHGPHFLTPT